MNEILRFKNIIIALLIVVVFSLIFYHIYKHYNNTLGELENKFEVLKEGRLTLAKWESLKKEQGHLRASFLSGEPTEFKRFLEEKARDAGVYVNSPHTLVRSSFASASDLPAALASSIACCSAAFRTLWAAMLFFVASSRS